MALLLTSTGSIVMWWKDHFEELLNSTSMHSMEKAEPDDPGLGSLTTRVEVIEAVKQLLTCVPQSSEFCRALLADTFLH